MLEVTRGARRWTLTLNRPDKANALTRDMLAAVADTVDAAHAAGVPVLVLTGAGKVFSAGADLEAARAGLATDPVWERVSGSIAAYPGLTICALNGTCAGGALGMMLACDLRVAVASAKVFYPVVKNGFLPQPSDPARLAALAGLSRAKLILLGGARIDAETALSWGLFDRLVPDAAVLGPEVDALAAEAEAASPDLLGAIKALCGATGKG
jgi:enoyl-CoA hydratase/carnithine racemase